MVFWGVPPSNESPESWGTRCAVQTLAPQVAAGNWDFPTNFMTQCLGGIYGKESLIYFLDFSEEIAPYGAMYSVCSWEK